MTTEKIAIIEARQEAQEKMISDVVMSLRDVGQKMSESTQALLENTIEQRHSREAIARVHERLDRHDTEINEINKLNSGNQPFIDLMSTINSRVWFMLVGIMFSLITMVSGIAYVVSKGNV